MDGAPEARLLRRIETAEIQTLCSILGDEARQEFGKLTVVHRADDPIGSAPRLFGLNPRILGDLEAALDALAREHLHPEQMSILVVGDAESVGPTLVELGYGEPVRLDIDGNRLDTDA